MGAVRPEPRDHPGNTAGHTGSVRKKPKPLQETPPKVGVGG